MKRMHSLWVQKRPELAHLTPQNLRDQVSAIKRRPVNPNERQDPPEVERRVESREIEVQTQVTARRQELTEGFHGGLHRAREDRRQRRIHFKRSIPQASLGEINSIVDEYLPDDCDLWTLDSAVYAAAMTLTTARKSGDILFKWKKRLQKIEEKVSKFRKKASRTETVIAYLREGRQFTSKVKRIARKIKAEHHTMNISILGMVKEQAVDKLRSLKLIRKKIEKTIQRLEQNARFAQAPATFLGRRSKSEDGPPLEETERFWRDLYETRAECNLENPAIKAFERTCAKLAQPNSAITISVKDIQNALKGKKNYSAPGPDSVNMFWWKKIPATHKHLARLFNQFMSDPATIPDWIAEKQKGRPKKATKLQANNLFEQRI